MPDESLRRRLAALNRAPLPVDDVAELARRAAAANSAPHVRRSVTAAERFAPLGPAVVPSPSTRLLTQMIERGVDATSAEGSYLCIRLPVDDAWPGGETLVWGRHRALAEPPTAAPPLTGERPPKRADKQRAEELQTLTRAFPNDLLCLDLETCGLAGAALFLIGLLRWLDGRLTIELLLARHYGEEKAVLAALWERISHHTVLVTFNGKSFDWPVVQDRSTRHLLSVGRDLRDLRHVDLLHAARRRWKERLPDCKLQTLERWICGRQRDDDIPGSRIPAAYEQFVRSGTADEMNAILRHNALDLITLLDLTMRLAMPLLNEGSIADKQPA